MVLTSLLMKSRPAYIFLIINVAKPLMTEPGWIHWFEIDVGQVWSQLSYPEFVFLIK